MRGNPPREHVAALLKVTSYCGRHNRRYRCWTMRGGKLVAQHCYECEKADQAARDRAEEDRHG